MKPAPRPSELLFAPRAPARVGFTLLEVLLTTMLSAVLLLGLWTLFGIYLKLFALGQNRADEAQLVRAISRQFDVDLHAVVQMPPDPIKTGTPVPGLAPGSAG